MPLWAAGNAFIKFISDEDLYRNFLLEQDDSEMQSTLAWYGIPSLMGITLTANLESPFASMSSMYNTITNVAAWEQTKELGAALTQSFASLQRGEALSNDISVKRAMWQAFSPRAINRAVLSVENEILISIRTGNPIAPVDRFNEWMHRLGFNDVALQKIYDTREVIWKDSTKRKDTLRRYAQEYVEAQKIGNTPAMTRSYAIAIASGVPVDSFFRSVALRLSRAEPSSLEDIFKTIDRQASEPFRLGSGGDFAPQESGDLQRRGRLQ